MGYKRMEKEQKKFGEHLTKQQLIEADACVNCGECLKWCPIQDVTDDHQICPPERIREFRKMAEATRGLKGKILGYKEIDQETMERFRNMTWKCVLCGNCGEVCEVGIDTKKLWWSLRRSVCESSVGTPEPMKGSLANFQEYHSPFPKPLTHRYKLWLPEDIEVAPKAEVGLYEGCGGAWDAPPSAEGAARLLSAGGSFTMLDAEDGWCCGWPMVAGSGDWSILSELVPHFVNAVKDKGIKRLALICPMCRDIFMYLYPEYYGDELPFECVMVSEVIAEYVEEGRIKFTKSLNEKVTNHDPCAMARPFLGPPILDAPRKILNALPGVELVEMERTGENTRCCGSSAGQRALNPDLATQMAKELLMEGKRSGADTMLTSCTACYVILQPRTHITPDPTVDDWKKYEEPIKVNDLLQYVSRFL